MCQGGCCGPKGMQIWAIAVALIAIGAFSVAIFVPPAIDKMLDDGVNDAILIDANSKADNSKAYQLYVNPEHEDATPVYFKVWLWNLKNGADVITGTKPLYEEKGPYVYRKLTFKDDVEFSKNIFEQDLVSYRTHTRYDFQRDMTDSTLSESDVITNVNPVFLLTQGTSTGSFYGQAAQFGLQHVYFTSHNVTEWLFGYKDPVLSYLHSLFGDYAIEKFPGLIGANQGARDPKTPLDVQYVGTKPDQALIRVYKSYHGMEYLVTPVFTPPTTVVYVPTWRTSQANLVQGTDASQFPRGLQDGQTLKVYISQLSRTVTVGNVNSEHVTLKGIDLLKFTLPDKFLLNSGGNPGNADYWMIGYNGMANLTAAGTKDFFVSKPHYLDVDAAIIASLDGVSAPNDEDHDTVLLVEPITGATMKASKRLQLSIRITPVPVAIPFNNSYIYQTWGAQLPNAANGGQYMPIYWGEESAELSDSQASTFKGSVYAARTLSSVIVIVGEVVACAFVVLAIVLFVIASNKVSGKVLPETGSSAPAAGGSQQPSTEVVALRGVPSVDQ